MTRSSLTAMDVRILPIRRIDASGRLRPVDPAKAQLIADGIMAWRAQGHVGIPAPIIVRPIDAENWKLVAGAHRLSAAELLGDTEIDAIVQQLGEHQARLVEIDENLCRAELNALDRAAFLAERDRVWRDIYPDTGKGKGGAKARWHHATDNLSFASATSDRIGLSERSIRREVKLIHLLASTPDVIDRIRGTWLEDHQGQLMALARLDPADRGPVLDCLLRAEAPARNVAAAHAEVWGHRTPPATPEEKIFAALVAQWTRANAKTRGRFLDHLHAAGALDAYTTGIED